MTGGVPDGRARAGLCQGCLFGPLLLDTKGSQGDSLSRLHCAEGESTDVSSQDNGDCTAVSSNTSSSSGIPPTVLFVHLTVFSG